MYQHCRHPSEYFIKYLLTLTVPEAQDNDWICHKVKTIGYPSPDDDYLDFMRETLYEELPIDYDPKDRYNRDSVKYLRKFGIWSMHNPDHCIKESIEILANMPARKIIENLLLGRIDEQEVVKKANSRLNSFFTLGGIQAYRHYYWNISLLRTKDWAQFFKDYEETEASRSMAVLRGGPSMALHETGFNQNIECKEIIKEMMEGLYFDFKDWKSQPRSLQRTRALTNLAKAATQLDVRMSEADSALRDSLKAFEAFRMEHAQRGVQSIEDLAPHGNFTESGAELMELPPSVKDKVASDKG